MLSAEPKAEEAPLMSPRVKKKYRIVELFVCENFLDLMELGAQGGPG